jgi:maltose O-acetyltransferase
MTSRERLWRVFIEEWGSLRYRALLPLALARVLPEHGAFRTRTALVRLAGIEVGSGTTMAGRIQITGRTLGRMRVGERCFINTGCHFDLTASITIGDHVALGQDVMILTNSHQIGTHDSRAADEYWAPVRIGNGVWIGARSTILPGVTIGAGAVVAAGAVVTEDVSGDSLVGGIPARVLRDLPATAGE